MATLPASTLAERHEAAVTRPAWLRFDPRTAGALLCVAGLALLTRTPLVTTALGIELLAAGFWCWARAAEDAPAQVPRWAWLRRPASALWLAVAVHATLPGLGHTTISLSGVAEMLRLAEAIAVVWAGLELMAALPLARTYSDLPGPLLSIRPWLPVVLPAAGFVVLWRQSPHWISVTEVRNVAVPLLLLTSVLGALRAFARRQWTASLRWLAVSDCALAGVLVARSTISPSSSLLLWLAACGGHAFLLAGELRGATPRRGALNVRLWRAASWASIVALSWPTLVAVGFGSGRGLNPIYLLAASIPTALAAWIIVGRMVEAPERRRIVRVEGVLTIERLSAILVLGLGPVALLFAWWSGFEPPWRVSLVALAPAVLGGLGAGAARRGTGKPIWNYLHRIGDAAPGLAGGAYQFVVGIERRVVGILARTLRAVTTPLHDLHTGDAQEYLLFLVGLGVLALVLPLLD